MVKEGVELQNGRGPACEVSTLLQHPCTRHPSGGTRVGVMLPWCEDRKVPHVSKSSLLHCLIMRVRNRSLAHCAQRHGSPPTLGSGIAVPLVFWGPHTPVAFFRGPSGRAFLLSLPHQQDQNLGCCYWPERIQTGQGSRFRRETQTQILYTIRP